ncbi:hypothetical protein ACWD3J_24315 [Streptomyces sp. NPDC002755]|uniref:hypothetical protein n=1 Tax=Streptomyces sp. NPDC002884 TaxID=3154544 RepID=UPI003320CA86
MTAPNIHGTYLPALKTHLPLGRPEHSTSNQQLAASNQHDRRGAGIHRGKGGIGSVDSSRHLPVPGIGVAGDGPYRAAAFPVLFMGCSGPCFDASGCRRSSASSGCQCRRLALPARNN